jgi:hypothetical protein
MSWISMPRWGINGQKKCMVSEKWELNKGKGKARKV